MDEGAGRAIDHVLSEDWVGVKPGIDGSGSASHQLLFCLGMT